MQQVFFLGQITALCLTLAACQTPMAGQKPDRTDAPTSAEHHGKGHPPRPQGPMMDAQALKQTCQGKAVGDAVSMDDPRGQTMQGSCQLMFVPNSPDAPPPR